MRFFLHGVPVVFFSVLLTPLLASALVNGGFEQGSADAVPDGWRFGCSQGCDGSLAVDTEMKIEGARAVRMANNTGFAPNVYCGLAQVLTDLTPGVTYRISFQAKGRNVGVCWYGGGPGWTRRKMLPGGTFDWRQFCFEWQGETGQTTYEFRINVDSPTEALWIDDMRITAMTDDAPVVQETLSRIGASEARIQGLRAALERTASEGLAVAYPRADIAVAERFCSYARDDIANTRFERAEKVAGEIAEILDRAEKEMRNNVDVPALKADSPIEIRDGSLWATCSTKRGDEMRPVFLTGYGHFNPAIEDLPLFSQIGINVIQIEIGPESTVFPDGVRTNELEQHIGGALDRAQANGARVCLLLSPHYFPQWAFEKWPTLLVKSSGFLNNALDAPEARDIYRKHIEAVISVTKGHPALHSICLSNEPVSLASSKDPYRLPLWHAYIQRKHGTIEALNALYGTSYASFDEVPHPDLSFKTPRVPLYDAVRFNQEAFAEWHAWMVSVIHEIAPDLPCHAKVMALAGNRDTVFWGTDPWDFAKLSQLNGNDCSYMSFDGGQDWVCDWHTQNMYYDLQRSMKRLPIFNTENHIIRDRETGYIWPAHIYAAIWQGAIHGQGASTTWTWQRTYDAKSDFEGLILHRAGCTAAMSRCALDLMRLSREVAAAQNLQPAIALLYSHASTLADPRHVDERSTLYAALNFTGIPIAFITEEQVAAGMLEQYKCLFVAGAKASTSDAIGAMRKWVASGGRMVEYDTGNLQEDEYGRSVEPPTFAESFATCSRTERLALRDRLLDFLTGIGLGPEWTPRTEDGKVPLDVEWRVARCDGHRIVNLINYSSAPMQVALPDGGWRDLVNNQPKESSSTLEPEVPLLIAQE